MNIQDDDIKAIGEHRWLKKHLVQLQHRWWYWILVALWGIVAVAMAWNDLVWVKILGVVEFLSVVLPFLLWIWWGQVKAGREMLDYWKKHGDLPQE